MNKPVLRILALCSLASGGLLHAVHEMRTPISLMHGPTNYPLPDAHETWWADLMRKHDEKKDHDWCGWEIESWKGGYWRSASKAFRCPTDKCETAPVVVADPCNPGCTKSSKKQSLAALWFGKESFKGEEAFFGGMLDATTNPNVNPFLSFSTITPNFDYNEYGAVLGLQARRHLGAENQWQIGGRVSIPFGVIEIEQDFGCGSNGVESGLQDVAVEIPLNVDASGTGNGIDYAYRLDFLSTLIRPALPSNQARPLVQYGDGGANSTQIGGVIVSGSNAANATAIYLVKSPTGQLPALEAIPNTIPIKYSYGKTRGQVSAAVGANGEGTGNLFFLNTTNYAGGLQLNRAAQSQLFVVPRINDDGGVSPVPTELAPNGVAVRNAIRAILNTLESSNQDSAADFFRKNCCIDLCAYERVVGLGDLEAEIFGGYNFDRAYLNGALGLRLPTGKRVKDPRRIYAMPIGNNGHAEGKIGIEGGWRPCHWFAFKGDFSFNHAFKREQKKAAPFKGATIKNIGPAVSADVSWNYFVLHTDLNFFHPHTTDIGCSFGYELFARRKDHISLCTTKLQDCTGVEQELDCSVLAKCTNGVAHKLRTEFFHRWNYWQIFAGGSHVVGGRNTMQETEAHVGVMVYF